MIQHIKNIALCLIMTLCFFNNYAQPKIARVEYYIDTDPGYGNATSINILPGINLMDSTVKIDPASLAAGVHMFCIRAKDSSGLWSLDNKWLFVKDAAPADTPKVIKVEYYIDSDPGYGNSTDTSITPGTNLSNLTSSINTSSLSAGVHLFGIRAKDANGAWSLDNKWLFVKDAISLNTPNIVSVEYYIDTDLGYGGATPVNITPATNLPDFSVNVNTGQLGDGTHIFGIRARDASGAWSLDNKWSFIVNGPLPIILTNLTGKYINQQNELTALIQVAVNVKAVDVERSTDGTHFKYIGNMALAPVTTGIYKYEDKNPPAGKNFYRLRIIDKDGGITYSYIISLHHTSQFTVQLYPNPVQDNLNLHFENASAGIYTIRLTDILGKDVLLHKVNISQNNQTGEVNIPFGNYTAGTYFIAVFNPTNKINTVFKIIKK